MKPLDRPSHTVRFPIWIAVVVIVGLALALSAHRIGLPVIAATASEQAEGAAALVFGGKIPPGYRDWTLMSLAVVGSPYNDIRANLGNDVVISAFREGKITFPDRAIIARLAWKQVTSELKNNAIRRDAVAKGLSINAVQKLLNNSSVTRSQSRPRNERPLRKWRCS
jgi:predicted HTH domain antitoxin